MFPLRFLRPVPSFSSSSPFSSSSSSYSAGKIITKLAWRPRQITSKYFRRSCYTGEGAQEYDRRDGKASDEEQERCRATLEDSRRCELKFWMIHLALSFDVLVCRNNRSWFGVDHSYHVSLLHFSSLSVYGIWGWRPGFLKEMSEKVASAHGHIEGLDYGFCSICSSILFSNNWARGLKGLFFLHSFLNAILTPFLCPKWRILR